LKTIDRSTPIAAVPNLGPVTAEWLADIGVATFGDLRALGSVEAYARLRFRHGRLVNRNALHAMEAAIRGIDWRRLPAEDKAALDRAVTALAAGPPSSGHRPE
jgi:DNA transformation protein